MQTFCPHLGSFCVVSSFTTFRPNFTSGLHQVILPRPRIGMLSLVTVSPVITAFHSCLSHHLFDQVNLWPAWVGFETAVFWQCSPGTVETQRLYPLRHGKKETTQKLPRWGQKERRNNTKTSKMRTKSPQKIKINSQIKNPHLKMIPIKDSCDVGFASFFFFRFEIYSYTY